MIGYRIFPARSVDDLAAVSDLFARYAASLPVDLDYQDFSSEMASLPGKYARPHGELLLARNDNDVAIGCVGLRPLGIPGCCEMKRLFLLPAARGLGLGRALTLAVVEEARAAGYSELRLDTLPTMEKAMALYEQCGFERMEAYYEPTPPGTVFMALQL